MTVVVRVASTEWAQEIAALSAQLGYAITSEQAHARITQILTQTSGAIFGALIENYLCGWLHIYPVPLIESEGYAEIGGIIVAQSRRRQGVGAALMDAAAAWTRAQKFVRIRAYSGSHRLDAHAFYRAYGFAEARPGVFTCTL